MELRTKWKNYKIKRETRRLNKRYEKLNNYKIDVLKRRYNLKISYEFNVEDYVRRFYWKKSLENNYPYVGNNFFSDPLGSFKIRKRKWQFFLYYSLMKFAYRPIVKQDLIWCILNWETKYHLSNRLRGRNSFKNFSGIRSVEYTPPKYRQFRVFPFGNEGKKRKGIRRLVNSVAMFRTRKFIHDSSISRPMPIPFLEASIEAEPSYNFFNFLLTRLDNFFHHVFAIAISGSQTGFHYFLLSILCVVNFFVAVIKTFFYFFEFLLGVLFIDLIFILKDLFFQLCLFLGIGKNFYKEYNSSDFLIKKKFDFNKNFDYKEQIVLSLLELDQWMEYETSIPFNKIQDTLCILTIIDHINFCYFPITLEELLKDKEIFLFVVYVLSLLNYQICCNVTLNSVNELIEMAANDSDSILIFFRKLSFEDSTYVDNDEEFTVGGRDMVYMEYDIGTRNSDWFKLAGYSTKSYNYSKYDLSVDDSFTLEDWCLDAVGFIFYNIEESSLVFDFFSNRHDEFFDDFSDQPYLPYLYEMSVRLYEMERYYWVNRENTKYSHWHATYWNLMGNPFRELENSFNFYDYKPVSNNFYDDVVVNMSNFWELDVLNKYEHRSVNYFRVFEDKYFESHDYVEDMIIFFLRNLCRVHYADILNLKGETQAQENYDDWLKVFVLWSKRYKKGRYSVIIDCNNFKRVPKKSSIFFGYDVVKDFKFSNEHWRRKDNSLNWFDFSGNNHLIFNTFDNVWIYNYNSFYTPDVGLLYIPEKKIAEILLKARVLKNIEGLVRDYNFPFSEYLRQHWYYVNYILVPQINGNKWTVDEFKFVNSIGGAKRFVYSPVNSAGRSLYLRSDYFRRKRSINVHFRNNLRYRMHSVGFQDRFSRCGRFQRPIHFHNVVMGQYFRYEKWFYVTNEFDVLRYQGRVSALHAPYLYETITSEYSSFRSSSLYDRYF